MNSEQSHFRNPRNVSNIDESNTVWESYQADSDWRPPIPWHDSRRCPDCEEFGTIDEFVTIDEARTSKVDVAFVDDERSADWRRVTSRVLVCEQGCGTEWVVR